MDALQDVMLVLKNDKKTNKTNNSSNSGGVIVLNIHPQVGEHINIHLLLLCPTNFISFFSHLLDSILDSIFDSCALRIYL